MTTVYVEFTDDNGGIYRKEFDFMGGETLTGVRIGIEDVGDLMRFPFRVDGDHYLRLSHENIQDARDAMCLNCRERIVVCDAQGCGGRKAVGWRTQSFDAFGDD